jgi:hypothetical protein
MASSHPWHVRKLIFFLLLSLADWFLTWELIRRSDGEVYEGNPLAGLWLASYGWTGLAVFKILAVILVLTSCLWISYHRRRAGGWLLIFACAVTGSVVSYSMILRYYPNGTRLLEREEASLTRARSVWLEWETKVCRDHRKLMKDLTGELAARRCTLGQAVERLLRSEKGQDPRWLTARRQIIPCRTDQECLAIYLLQYTYDSLCRNPVVAHVVCNRLEAEYEVAYGAPAPLSWMRRGHPRASDKPAMARQAGASVGS